MIEYLYHYTNIDTLAAILETQQIKFNRLDKVNDITEGDTNDFGSLSPFIFVSCWTAQKEENISLWHMYTKHLGGVRLKFKTPLFQGYNSKGCIVYPEMYYDTNCIALNHEPLTKVIYTNDKSKLKPDIKGDIGIELSKLAIHKSKYWSVEREYRFVIIFIPVSSISVTKNEIQTDIYNNLVNHVYPQFDSFYLSLNQETLKSMELTLGPKISYGDEIIVKSLVDKYNNGIKITKSRLTGKIR